MKTCALSLLLMCALTARGETTVQTKTLRLFSVEKNDYVLVEPIIRTDAEWRKALTPEQYRVTRTQGTECAYTGALYKNKEKGVYRCLCCDTDLFSSRSKFESGTGWPSFFTPVDPANITSLTDRSHGMVRTEVNCSRCGAHLGHVFEDGPAPTGLRYCINSAAMKFVALK